MESFLIQLDRSGFDEDRLLFAYRTFNWFLLGFLLLELSSAAAASVPTAGLSRVASPGGGPEFRGDVDASRYPTVHRLAHKFTCRHDDEGFTAGVNDLVGRIASPPHPRGRGI